MDRYSIAKNEKPKAPEPVRVQTFGFDSEPDTVSKLYRKEVFTMPLGQSRRVGIVFEDPKKVFTVGTTHFHEHRYFLCKSTPQWIAPCCQQGLSTGKRFVCVLVEYGDGDDTTPISISRVAPWVFGSSVYAQLKEANRGLSDLGILSKDFLLRRSAEHFRPWDIITLPDNSLWQTAVYRDTVLAHARPHFKNLKKYIGEDLTPAQLKELFDTHPVATPGGDNLRYRDRSIRSRRDQIESEVHGIEPSRPTLRLNQVNIRDFVDEVNRADDIARRTGATPISGTGGRTAPYPAARTEDDQQINLDDLFRTLDI
jgi:hypothetical protein